MTTAEQLAQHLRDAYGRSMEDGLAAAGEFIADEFELAHEPPHVADGMKTGAEMAAMWAQEGSMLKAAMPDVALTDIEITSSGDDVTLSAHMRGTSPDGSTLAHPYTVVYTLREGKVARACASYDPAPVAKVNMKAFQASQPEEA
jgi:ketosteroid isomerase-like protein